MFNLFQFKQVKVPTKVRNTLFWSSACNDLLLNAFKSSYMFRCLFFLFSEVVLVPYPSNPLIIRRVFFPFVVFMAPFCNGISYAGNTSCHETPGMNLSIYLWCLVKYLYYLWISCLLYDAIYPGKIEEILAILEGCRSSYSSGSGNAFCKNISPTINFFGKNQMDLGEATKLDLKIRQ